MEANNPQEPGIGRRTFFKTSGFALAGLGLPVNVISGNVPEADNHSPQQLPGKKYQADYVVVGGGVAGVCSAITAARAGLKVLLIQDRPVLGGNASSEIRLWVLGATAHMGNNNRWAREGGIHEEIIVENLYRNREGNPVFFDALLIEKVWAEPNITLLLNTAVHDVEMASPDKIGKVIAFCSQNSTLYEVSAPLFCDTSGDGIVGFLSGADFRVGAESTDVFGEKFIMPDDYGKLLGHSMYFYSKDTGRPVKYVPPAFALKNIPEKIPRFKSIHRTSSGCRLWWLEWGDDLDRVFDSEKIKDELWRVVYGVWDYIKNSGTFKDVDHLTLEWVSTIPGKRESRRFEGDYMLKQQDIIGQEHFEDAIAYGGWAIDLHPATGVYSTYPGCTQYHSKGVYTIPYRCIYSRNISNLFMGGRLTSVSHVAFGSTRVISTGTLCAQAAAFAASLCLKNNASPRDICSKEYIGELQRMLMQSGQYIPGLKLEQPSDLFHSAKISTSGNLELSELPEDGQWWKLTRDTAMIFPFPKGKLSKVKIKVKPEKTTSLEVQFCISGHFGNYTPDVVLARKDFQVSEGTSEIEIDFKISLKEAQYGFIILKKNENLSVAQSDIRLTGVLSLFYRWNQKENEKHGVEEIPMYTPGRRPGGKNIAMKFDPALKVFGTEQLKTGIFRPGSGAANSWIAPLNDKQPFIICEWKQVQSIRSMILWFDTDFDHPMESCLMGHPEDVIPFCVQKYNIVDDKGTVIYEKSDNHHSRNEIKFEKPVQTKSLTVQFHRSHENVPVSLFGLQIFG
ncbi:MAG: FAD-dependent oxidoreductase [Bacteroidales bacterium]|jgi:hypothetical protein|nr:FAD-dependent oxidoreductase [Bacteroidales bacterium]